MSSYRSRSHGSGTGSSSIAMASTACAAGDRCVHPADHTDEGLWTSCHVCGKFFHMKCRPKRHTVGLGDPAADDCMRAGAAVFHCPGECLDKAKEVGGL